jgi:hypothetical protein
MAFKNVPKDVVFTIFNFLNKKPSNANLCRSFTVLLSNLSKSHKYLYITDSKELPFPLLSSIDCASEYMKVSDVKYCVDFVQYGAQKSLQWALSIDTPWRWEDVKNFSSMQKDVCACAASFGPYEWKS